MKTSFRILLLASAGVAAATFAIQAQTQQPMATADQAPEQPQKPVTKTDAEWRKQLTAEQYRFSILYRM